MVTAFTPDPEWFARGVRCVKSFMQFNKNTVPCYCDFGWFSPDQRANLEWLGIRRLTRLFPDHMPTHKSWIDLLLQDFLEGQEWHKVMWLDADSIVLRNLEDLFLRSEDFVSPPARGRQGCFTVEDGRPRYSLNMWVTSSPKLLGDMYEASKPEVKGVGNEGRLISKILNEKYRAAHLDGRIYNFGRDVYPTARCTQGEIWYEHEGSTLFPAIATDSRLDDGNRPVSAAMEHYIAAYVDPWLPFPLPVDPAIIPYLDKCQILKVAIRIVRLSELKALVYSAEGDKEVPIIDTPAAQCLKGDATGYENYHNYVKECKNPEDDHTLKKFWFIVRQLKRHGYDRETMLMAHNGSNVLCDGQNRAAIMYDLYGDIEIPVLDVTIDSEG